MTLCFFNNNYDLYVKGIIYCDIWFSINFIKVVVRLVSSLFLIERVLLVNFFSDVCKI